MIRDDDQLDLLLQKYDANKDGFLTKAEYTRSEKAFAKLDRNHDDVVRECVKRVRDLIGPVAAFKQAIVVDRLPKTRSGKILRATLRRLANGEHVETPPTIENPAVLVAIRALFSFETSE